MADQNTLTSEPKFTRGEKCIFTHLILTIFLIVVLIIIYLVHILIVEHSGSFGIFGTRRTFLSKVVNLDLYNFPIGLLYLNTNPKRNICNAFLVAQEWSISPGHCVTIRSDPDLANYLPSWRIKYLLKKEGLKIKRSIAHPHFNRDSFENNIGLVQHSPIHEFKNYKIPKTHVIKYQNGNIGKTKLVALSWRHHYTSIHRENEENVDVYQVKIIPIDNCTSFVAPILELRPYELCIVPRSKIHNNLGYGTLILDQTDLTILGFFSWGETQQRFLPFVALNHSYFQGWINSVTVSML